MKYLRKKTRFRKLFLLRMLILERHMPILPVVSSRCSLNVCVETFSLRRMIILLARKHEKPTKPFWNCFHIDTIYLQHSKRRAGPVTSSNHSLTRYAPCTTKGWERSQVMPTTYLRMKQRVSPDEDRWKTSQRTFHQ